MRRLAIEERPRMMHADRRNRTMQLHWQRKLRQLVKRAFLRFMERLNRKRKRSEKRKLVWHKS